MINEVLEKYLPEGKAHRFTVYKLTQSGGGKAEFLEYLNNDELDTWMDANKSKYASIVVARSDGNWVTYDQPKGTTFEKGLSGKNFNKEWKGKYNKKADI